MATGRGGRLPISIVHACLRDGRGGSPTAVVDDAEGALSDAERCRVPARCGTSHAVFVTPSAPDDVVRLRFFTAEAELPACGHGTVAALAVLAARHAGAEGEFRLRASGRAFTGRTLRRGDRVQAAFDPGPVILREPTPAEFGLVSAALGVTPDLLGPGVRVASLGRPRLLVPVATAEAVAALAPDQDRLRAACEQAGLLGCYVHSMPTGGGRLVARMFAPAIGVPEDIANANSTACLAAHLADRGFPELRVDMGDALGVPATITTATQRTASGPRILVGGAATIGHTGVQ
ncbi:PhzF family phenazine biosynthesis protein [Plantactinospora siamensis]|uniref:PhzF family phenazine biosynthesis protein n=1 Tax=Plantactinospora siamensis TaxID=555372 RepID=A0ABV6NWU3_9ACTN